MSGSQQNISPEAQNKHHKRYDLLLSLKTWALFLILSSSVITLSSKSDLSANITVMLMALLLGLELYTSKFAKSFDNELREKIVVKNLSKNKNVFFASMAVLFCLFVALLNILRT